MPDWLGSSAVVGSRRRLEIGRGLGTESDRAQSASLDGAEEGEGTPSGAALASGCPPAEVVTAFVDGAVPPDEREQLERHFSDCDGCRELLSALALAQSGLHGESAASAALT